MDKRSILNDLYQAAVISVFAIGYLMLGKKILKMTPASIQEFDLRDTGKLVAIIAASNIRRESISSNRRFYQNTSMSKMASIVMLIGEALASALAFTGSSHLFLRLTKDSIDKE